VSSRSGVATLRTAIHLLLVTNVSPAENGRIDRDSFARTYSRVPNAQFTPHARCDKTVESVSCLAWRCELALRNRVLEGGNTGAVWRIPSVDPRAAAIRPYIKLLWTLASSICRAWRRDCLEACSERSTGSEETTGDARIV